MSDPNQTLRKYYRKLTKDGRKLISVITNKGWLLTGITTIEIVSLAEKLGLEINADDAFHIFHASEELAHTFVTRMAARGQQLRRKDKDLMDDVGRSVREKRQPNIRPPREDEKKRYRTKTKREKDPDIDQDPDVAGDPDTKRDPDMRKSHNLLDSHFTNRRIAMSLFKIAKEFVLGE